MIDFYTKLAIDFGKKCLYNSVMRIAKRVGTFIVLALILVSVGQPVIAAQDTGPEWFPQTQHSIRGEFLKFYHSVSDPLTLFGFPITDEYYDQTGVLTQYFQRARFDLQNTDHGPVVSLANLGWLLYDDTGQPYNIQQTGPTCRLFPATSKTVCYAFLQFYDTYQGEKFFGDPISGLEIRDGMIVQYFSKVRMEWHANLPEGRKVRLTQLGRTAFGMINGNYQTLNGSPILVRSPVSSITARAFVRDALIGANSTQTVYLIVQDQDNQPVAGVTVTVQVIRPDGSVFPMNILESTGPDGVMQIPLTVGDFSPRQVIQVVITASFEDKTAVANTWFRIWY